MNVDQAQIIGALIGAVATVVAALIAEYLSSESGKRSFWLVVAIGLATTAVVLSVFSWSEARTPQFAVVSAEIQAHTGPGQIAPGWRFPMLAPRVPEPAKEHEVSLRCDCGYVPIAAWHERVVSHPALDVMYTIDAKIRDGRPVVALRAREDSPDGYTYVQVLVLCSRVPGS